MKLKLYEISILGGMIGLLPAPLLARGPYAQGSPTSLLQPEAWGCQSAPGTPSGLSSPVQTSTTITLAWAAVSAPGGCAVTYNVYSNGHRVASRLTGTSTIITGLTPATSYPFRVDAADQAGHSAKSASFTVSTRAVNCTTVPAVPTGLAASSPTSSAVNLSWTPVSAPGSCSVFYYVYRNGTLIQTVTTASAAVTGLAGGTTYTFTVAAADAAGISHQCAGLPVTTAPATPCSAAPSVPTGLTSPSQTGSSVNLSWTAVSAPTGCSITYDVYQNGTLKLTESTTSAILNGLSPGTTYAFTVAAADSAGSSAQSAALSVTTPSSTPPTPAQVVAAVQANMTTAKRVSSTPDINNATGADVYVYQVLPGIFAYTSSMDIDDDGSDPNPDPDHQDMTTWQTTDGKALGANHVPYYVLGDSCPTGQSPCDSFFYPEHNISALQFALIFYNGQVIGAVFGDTGPDQNLGEASVESASLLGIPDSGISGGVENGVTYVVFSGSQWVLTGTNATLNGNAQALVSKAMATLATGLGL